MCSPEFQSISVYDNPTTQQREVRFEDGELWGFFSARIGLDQFFELCHGFLTITLIFKTLGKFQLIFGGGFYLPFGIDKLACLRGPNPDGRT